MKTISSWLLGGALAASLTWNWKLHTERPMAASGESCAESCAAGLDLGSVADPEKKEALEAVCKRSCGESDRLEQQAEELQRELVASLSADTVDRAAVGNLVAQIGELRRRSLESCVEGILGVRSVLSGEEARALLEHCKEKGCSTPSPSRR